LVSGENLAHGREARIDGAENPSRLLGNPFDRVMEVRTELEIDLGSLVLANTIRVLCDLHSEGKKGNLILKSNFESL